MPWCLPGHTAACRPAGGTVRGLVAARARVASITPLGRRPESIACTDRLSGEDHVLLAGHRAVIAARLKCSVTWAAAGRAADRRRAAEAEVTRSCRRDRTSARDVGSETPAASNYRTRRQLPERRLPPAQRRRAASVRDQESWTTARAWVSTFAPSTPATRAVSPTLTRLPSSFSSTVPETTRAVPLSSSGHRNHRREPHAVLDDRGRVAGPVGHQPGRRGHGEHAVRDDVGQPDGLREALVPVDDVEVAGGARVLHQLAAGDR